MIPFVFPEHTHTIAKDQPEYLPLPVHLDMIDPFGTVTSCWKLTPWERIKILFTGKLWVRQLTFRQKLQPFLPMVDTPFIGGEHLKGNIE